MKTQIFNPPYNDNIIDFCVAELKNGNIGIFPTDTVYGIGCDSLNIKSIQNLYHIKNRNLNKPISILISSIDMINDFVKDVNSIEEKLIENFWPGPLTIIFNKSETISNILTSNLDTVGIRMPDSQICIEIINKFGKPLAVSSANIADEPPDYDLESLLKDFNDKISFIINGKNLIDQIPSTIVKVQNNEIKILREGSITKNEILKCFGGNINVR